MARWDGFSTFTRPGQLIVCADYGGDDDDPRPLVLLRQPNPGLQRDDLINLDEAGLRWLVEDSKRAAKFHKDATKAKQDLSEFEVLLADPDEIAFGPVPRNTMPFALFLARTGAIKVRAAGWKDYFWETAHAFDGG